MIDGFERGSKGLQNSSLSFLNISHIVGPYPFSSIIRNTTFQYLKNTKLKVLVVEGCVLGNIDPQAITDLPKTMEYISFHDNDIRLAFPLLTGARLTNLKTARISNQRDDKFRESCTNYRALSYTRDSHTDKVHNLRADVSNNWISKIRRQHSRLKSMLPSKMTGLSLKALNTLDSTEESFCDNFVTGLKDYSLSETGYIPIPLPRNLENIYASDIKLSYNIPTIQIFNNKVLKIFDLSSNHFKCLGGPLYGLPSLHSLDLSKNGCEKLSPFFFSNLTSVRTLLLYQNQIGKSLAHDIRGETFSSLILLEKLDLSYNTIKYLPELIFKNNQNLRVLNLSNNALSHFRVDLANHKWMKILDLSNNLLAGLSESMCLQLREIKGNNPNFTVRMAGNNAIRCSCDNLYFLSFLLEEPDIFDDLRFFQCQLSNSSITYSRLSLFLPELADQCLAQSVFVAVLSVFFVMTGSVAVCALYHFKRWQWKYLYYVGRGRLHIGSTYLTYRPAAHVFVTYDQVGDMTAALKLNRTVNNNI